MEELAPDQSTVLEDFKSYCSTEGLLGRREGLQAGDVEDGITDNTTLLRYLEARRRDPKDALKQWQEASKFQADRQVLRLYDLISVEDYEATRKLYPHWTGRRDRRGRPILALDVAHLNASTMAAWRKTRSISRQTEMILPNPIIPDMEQRAAIHFDSLTRFVLPLCTAMSDRPDPTIPVTKSIYIVDASAISLKQAWDLRDFARDISWILSTCYPETIDRIIVGNAPFYFAKIWAFMKNFVDPITADKLVITRPADAYATMAEYMEHKDIPSQFGGGFQFTNGMLPDLDEGIWQALQWTISSKEAFPQGPLKWTEDENGQRRAVATGSIDSRQRCEEVAILPVNPTIHSQLPN
ncbi:CRAL/TRIO domain protein [Aspergillus eucalypticola CBS 122712]|uniref:CRAL/TRIO domain protein n=1 Tax=Aspergillus eucalypticola (strain CBS 122712 / IBT 29274) TaxID=1448314 RepID=A0A317VE66_ASPEC|nr:CRAL/TRIO domain protein [Aspergillus eucalypticola CBS 122712]PWY72596.1 CRAL/TRIO domain protein [Aspergillus eucalypticola CBS 122712]